jgi:hypothetical protein
MHSVIKYAGQFSPVANLQDALFLVISFGIKSEIIGSWLYCFTTPLIGFQLLEMGFWHSSKHGAYIYTGREKDNILPDGEILNEIT